MNKKAIIDVVAERLGLTKKATGEVVDAVFGAISDALVEGVEVKIAGFGAFSVKERPQREVRNPQTGGTMVAQASRAPKFRASKTLKDAMNA